MAGESEQRPHGVDGRPGIQSTPNGTSFRHVTLIPGEGAGADVMSAVRRVLHAAGAAVEWEVVEAGEQVRAKGIASGLPWETIDSIQRTGLVIRGSLALPGAGLGPTERVLHQGFEIASQAFRIRSLPGLCSGVGEHDLDFWLIRSSLREMEQELELNFPWDPRPTDMPAGPVDERVFRRAFQLARQEELTSVHCAIRSGRHGLLRVQRSFHFVAADYPQIRAECADRYLLAQKLIAAPEQFEVIVTSNTAGDVVTELAGRVAGGLSFMACTEVGAEVAMFTPGHAADIPLAGRGHANPVGAIRTGVLLLEHIGQQEPARRIERALATTLEQGLSPAEARRTRTAVSTSGFVDAVISNIDSERRSFPLRPDDDLPARARRWNVPRTATRLQRCPD